LFILGPQTADAYLTFEGTHMLQRYLDRIVFIVLLTLVAMPSLALSSDAGNQSSATGSNRYGHLAPAIDYLLDLTQKNNETTFDASRVESLFQFINTEKELGDSLSLGSRRGSSSDYYEFSVKRSLKEVLDLVYNPDIPSYFTTPSSVRRSHWIEVDGKKQPFPKLSEKLDPLADPVIIKGQEFNEITPDSQSGAYYSYTLDRVLILMLHKGRRMLISISNQPQKSEVGKKGLVLGSDEEWNYLYTGEKGVMMRGLGWAESYMYSSSSIMIYRETAGPEPAVQCHMFKWLKAGWAGMNLAEPHHIRKGVVRYVKSFKQVLEAPALDALPKVSAMLNKIESLPTDELRAQSRLYLDDLKGRFENKNSRNRKWFKKLFSDQAYINDMSRDELAAIVSIEYLKYLLGKRSRFDITYFTLEAQPAKRPG
jgi:hypothetical protein